jgi:ribosomal protein L24E
MLRRNIHTISIANCKKIILLTMSAGESYGASFESHKSQQEDGVKDDSFCNDFVQAGKGLLDVTFESDIFEFSVTDSTAKDAANSLPRSLSWFPDFSNIIEPTTVDVAVHEQVAATYNDFTQNGAITVKGSIYIRTAATSFELMINDESQNIQQFDPIESICTQKNDKAKNKILRIELKSSLPKDEILIANYFCTPKLRPVPLV